MSDAIANLIAKRFIARRDVKAVQHSSGAYTPHEKRDSNGNVIERYPWRRDDLLAHLSGDRTFGHYLLNTDNTTKLFAFDIDLEQNKTLPDGTVVFQGYYPEHNMQDQDESPELIPFDPRHAWLDRRHPSRWWSKYQMRVMAHKLMLTIHKELELPCAAAYSGGKGIHVYAFTGPVPAKDARDGAQLVLDLLGEFKATRGTNFFKHLDEDPTSGFPNLSIEVFPKQDSLDTKDLGNLMRLPLGRNLKSKDPTFFLDMTAPLGELVPLDAEYALSAGAENPWKRPNE